MPPDLATLERQPYLHVNLCSYRNAGEIADGVATFAEATFALASRAQLPLRIAVDRTPVPRPRRGTPLKTNAWRKAREQLADGSLQHLHVFDEMAVERAGMPVFSLRVQAVKWADAISAGIRDSAKLDDIRRKYGSTPVFLKLSIDLRALHAVLDARESAQLVAHSKQAFAEIEGACGFVTLDTFAGVTGDVTAYELARRRYWVNEPAMYSTRLQGIFWGNLASTRHIDLLGGFERVRRLAPCHRVEPLENAGRSVGAYLQLTEELADCPQTAKRALEEFCAPLLEPAEGG